MNLTSILQKLNIDKSSLIYFNNAKLENLSFNTEKRIYTINISLDEPLPASVYVSTLEAFQNYLSQAEKNVLVALYIKLNKESNDCKIVKDYITFFVDRKVNNPSDYQFLKEQSIEFTNILLPRLTKETLNLSMR